MSLHECPCGSGLCPFPAEDARGIFLTYVCDRCEARRLRKFRPDVLIDPQYPCNEPVEPEDAG